MGSGHRAAWVAWDNSGNRERSDVGETETHDEMCNMERGIESHQVLQPNGVIMCIPACTIQGNTASNVSQCHTLDISCGHLWLSQRLM